MGLNSITADAMEYAADQLESGQLEWLQYRMFARNNDNDVTGVCLVGSIYHAAQLHGQHWAHILRTAKPALQKVIDHQFLARWNDMLDRTKEHVIDALKTAAKDLRNDAS